MQVMFNPIDYGFLWTSDWYAFDRQSAQKAALKARNAEAKRLEALGKRVTKFTLHSQLISKGGIGSGKPHIEEVVNVYGLNAY